jgi:hypothetical protein
MRLQVGCIDHQLVRLPALRRERCEDLVEHAEPAPADEAVVDRLRRPILNRRVAPPQAVPDGEDDAADDPPIIDPRNIVRQRKMRLDPAHLRLRKLDQITHGGASSRCH